jgi:hypothetical protein
MRAERLEDGGWCGSLAAWPGMVPYRFHSLTVLALLMGDVLNAGDPARGRS